MSSNKIYSKYFIRDSRGYNIICKFYDRYKDELQTINYNSLDNLLNHISTNINSIELSKEPWNEEANIIGLIKIQCRMLIDQISKTDGSTNEEISGIYPPEMKDIIKRITEFKLRLEPKELEIFNSLIDEESKEDLSDEGISTSSYNNTVKKLRSRFNSYLRALGFKYENFFPQKNTEQ